MKWMVEDLRMADARYISKGEGYQKQLPSSRIQYDTSKELSNVIVILHELRVIYEIGGNIL